MGLLIPTPLSKEEIGLIVQDKLRWILQSVEPRAVILFGTAAREQMTDRSDVDIAVIFADEASLKSGRASIYAQPMIDSWPTDLLFFTEAQFEARRRSGGVCELIWREGKAIYGRLG